MVTPIINGNDVTCLKEQLIGFSRMFENLKGRIHLAKESRDELSSIFEF